MEEVNFFNSVISLVDFGVHEIWPLSTLSTQQLVGIKLLEMSWDILQLSLITPNISKCFTWLHNSIWLMKWMVKSNYH